MKIFKSMAFVMVILFGMTSMSNEPKGSSESSSVEATAVKECYLVYDRCDGLYPRDYSGFAGCMGRGGC